MLGNKATIAFRLLRAHERTFAFKSSLSLEILLLVAGKNGRCFLKDIFKSNLASSIALRQHVSLLEEDGLIALLKDPQSKRQKFVSLTKKAIKLLFDYERDVEELLNEWSDNFSDLSRVGSL
jgi:DNA-binding MarR family transcriptional regulator